jgi:hypothetical protein
MEQDKQKNEPENEPEIEPEMNPRAKQLFEWIKEQDTLSVERLRAQVKHINEHYSLYHKKEE